MTDRERPVTSRRAIAMMGAAGDHSGFGGGASSTTFLRDGQITDAAGRVAIRTIYPGRYQGRTVHIRVKVQVGGDVVHTGQRSLDDAPTDRVFTAAPNDERPGPRTTNDQDAIHANGGPGPRSLLRGGATGSWGP
ncbi:MAG TPA: hypothetical protein VID47_03125 [Actinomycetota bacterium]|jgi:protocatechuate 3,4-dioxygenase beta subunit